MSNQLAMSAFGTKQTSHHAQLMSAFGGKADISGAPIRCLFLTHSGPCRGCRQAPPISALQNPEGAVCETKSLG